MVVVSTILLACSKQQDTSATATEVSQEHEMAGTASTKVANAQTPIAKPLKLAVNRVKVGSLFGEQQLDRQATGQAPIFKENTTFGRKDAVHLIVETIGSGRAILKAQWGYMTRGKQKYIGSSSQTVTATGPMATLFTMLQELPLKDSPPKDQPLKQDPVVTQGLQQGRDLTERPNLKVGSYRVEIWLDDVLTAVKEFRVE